MSGIHYDPLFAAKLSPRGTAPASSSHISGSSRSNTCAASTSAGGVSQTDGVPPGTSASSLFPVADGCRVVSDNEEESSGLPRVSNELQQNPCSIGNPPCSIGNPPPACPVCLHPSGHSGGAIARLSCGHEMCEDCRQRMLMVARPRCHSVRVTRRGVVGGPLATCPVCRSGSLDASDIRPAYSSGRLDVPHNLAVSDVSSQKRPAPAPRTLVRVSTDPPDPTLDAEPSSRRPLAKARSMHAQPSSGQLMAFSTTGSSDLDSSQRRSTRIASRTARAPARNLD